MIPNTPDNQMNLMIPKGSIKTNQGLEVEVLEQFSLTQSYRPVGRDVVYSARPRPILTFNNFIYKTYFKGKDISEICVSTALGETLGIFVATAIGEKNQYFEKSGYCDTAVFAEGVSNSEILKQFEKFHSAEDSWLAYHNNVVKQIAQLIKEGKISYN